jgi:hypothetical protein
MFALYRAVENRRHYDVFIESRPNLPFKKGKSIAFEQKKTERHVHDFSSCCRREREEAPKKEITPENLLLSASLAGDVATVQTLLSSGVSVNCKGEKDYTALHNSTRNGHTVSFHTLCHYTLCHYGDFFLSSVLFLCM